VTGTTYNDTAAEIGMLYYYKVRAHNTSGASEFSNYDSGQAGTMPIPDSPQNVQATDGSFLDKVTVTWDAAAGAETYSLYKSVADGATDVLVAASIVGTTYNVTPINPGRYYFKVKAVNRIGESDLSLADGGYRGVTDNEFFELFDQTNRRMDEKVNLESQSDERCDGDISGTFFKDVQIAGLGANVYLNFTNYCDFFSARRKITILASTTYVVKANISGNGSKTGRVNISGVYSGYIDHNLTISNKAVSSGTFTVKQTSNSGSTTLQWNYAYTLSKYAFLKDPNEK
jgi:hypothetical protein